MILSLMVAEQMLQMSLKKTFTGQMLLRVSELCAVRHNGGSRVERLEEETEGGHKGSSNALSSVPR